MLTTEKREQTARRRVWLFAGLSLVLSLGLAAATKNYPYDGSCFLAWSQRMANVGAGGFYGGDYFCDYPPAYILLLWLPGKLMSLPHFGAEAVQRVLLAFLPALSGAALAPVCYRLGRRFNASPETALRIAAAAAFCPALLYDTGVWGQIDALFALLMLGCFAFLEEKRWAAGALCYGAALAVKPQALLVGPVLAICFLWPLLYGADKAARLAALKNGVLGAAAALCPVLLCGLPFWGVSGLWQGLVEKYFTTATSYPYATINACNLMSLLGGEWAAQDGLIPIWGFSLPLSWRQLGILLLGVLMVYVAVLARRAQRAGRFSPLLLAAVYGAGVFALSHRMHERYLIFAAILLLGAAARFSHKKLLALSYGFALCSVLNMALVYNNVGTDDEFLSSATSGYMLRFVGLAVVVLFFLLAQAAWKILAEGENEPFAADTASGWCGDVRRKGSGNNKKSASRMDADACADGKRRSLHGESARRSEPGVPAMLPAWTKKELLGLAGLTAAAALVSFVYLGDTTAPQKLLDVNGGYAETTVSVEGDAAELWVYPGISTDNNGSISVLDASGTVLGTLQLSHGSVFTWNRLMLAAAGPYTIQISDAQIVELAFHDAQGNLLAVSGQGADTALFDEQALVPDTISQLNSMYFDEIYHARTGYEMLHGMTVYETTHPPLGKDFILLGIALFGMTGFGWRFAGTLFGVLLVPLLYCFVRRLTHSPRLGLFAALLLSFDFMRFSQSRLATIDTYAVFFILLGADMMVWYCQKVLRGGVTKAILPMALAGAAFGLGCASKWTGIYAGAGLAILYFGVLAERGRMLKAAGGEWQKPFRREVLTALLGGVAFFVAVPLLIYWLSYLPYRLRDSSFGLSDWWNCQTYMYWYHSTLNATHPFSSSWYAWLLDLRPVWYYMGSNLPDGRFASIAGFVNPVIALAGLAAWLRLAHRQLVGEGSRAGAAVIILLLSSLLPWVMVARCTFLYHYFPCVPFLIAALALCIQRWSREDEPTAGFAAILLVAGAAVLFVWFYPSLSGLPVGRVWAAAQKWLSSWGFYIL